MTYDSLSQLRKRPIDSDRTVTFLTVVMGGSFESCSFAIWSNPDKESIGEDCSVGAIENLRFVPNLEKYLPFLSDNSCINLLCMLCVCVEGYFLLGPVTQGGFDV
jgi:hypothetical protein